MSSSFTKSPREQYVITVAFCQPLPPGTTVASVSVSAIDQATQTDATTLVLEPDTATVTAEDEVQVFVKGGESGHAYRVRFLMPLTPGSPEPRLEEQVVMVVWDDEGG